MSRGLVVVDVQYDFCEGASLPVTGRVEVATAIADLLAGEHGYGPRMMSTRSTSAVSPPLLRQGHRARRV